MTFVTSPISFGLYTFPSGFTVLDQDQPFTIEGVKLPLKHREKAAPGFMSHRTIRVGGYVGGDGAVDSSGAFITNFEQAEAEANLIQQVCSTPMLPDTVSPSGARFVSQYQPLKIGHTDLRQIMAQSQGVKVQYLEGSGRRAIYIEVSFYCPFPAFEDAAETQVHVVAPSSGSFPVTITGSTKCWPWFAWNNTLFYSYATLFKVRYDQLPGTPYIQITQNAAQQLAANLDYFGIRTDPRERGVYYPGTSPWNKDAKLHETLTAYARYENTVGDGEFFPYLLPGTQTVFYDVGVHGADLFLGYRNAYLF